MQELPKLTMVRTWQRARWAVFTEEMAATSLARTPYDLRHAAVPILHRSTCGTALPARSLECHVVDAKAPHSCSGHCHRS
jgi:hypothetical protein